MKEKNKNTRNKSIEKDRIDEYIIHASLPVTIEGIVEHGSRHRGGLNVEGCLRNMKERILDRPERFTDEDMLFSLETYVNMVILKKLGIKDLPVNLRKNPNWMVYAKME